MKAVFLSALSLSLLASSLTNLKYLWKNSFQHRKAGRNLAEDSDSWWDEIQHQFRNTPEVELKKLAREIHSIYAYSGDCTTIKYIYSRFNTHLNEIRLCSSNVVQKHNQREDLASIDVEDHNIPLKKTSDMTIQNIKYTQIQETVTHIASEDEEDTKVQYRH